MQPQHSTLQRVGARKIQFHTVAVVIARLDPGPVHVAVLVAFVSLALAAACETLGALQSPYPSREKSRGRGRGGIGGLHIWIGSRGRNFSIKRLAKARWLFLVMFMKYYLCNERGSLRFRSVLLGDIYSGHPRLGNYVWRTYLQRRREGSGQ